MRSTIEFIRLEGTSMNRRRTLLTVAVSLALSFSGVSAASAAPDPFGSLGSGSTGTSQRQGCSADLLEGNQLLGPKTLATKAPVGRQVADYDRLAGLSPSAFLDKYYIRSASYTGWDWPAQDGFVIKPDGQPDKRVGTLRAGKRIDRYGPATGRFLAPAGTAYKKRALPPENLVDKGNPADCNYHIYSVAKSFKVQTGPIAPGFGQPGGGIQYQVDKDLIPAKAIADNQNCFSQTAGYVNTQWLLCAGYLTIVFPAP